MNNSSSSTNTQQARDFGAHPGIQNRGDSAHLGEAEKLPLQSSGQSSGLGDVKQQGSTYNLNSGVHHADNILNAVPLISQAKSGEHRGLAATPSYCMPPRTCEMIDA